MMPLRYLWYCVRLAFYLVRLVLYGLHALFYLFARVIAMPALPLLVVLGLWGLQDTVWVQQFTRGVATWFGELMGDDWGALFMEWRVGFTAIVMFVGLTWALSFFGGFFRPIATGLPVPRRPLMPMLPLHIPKHAVKSVRVREVVRSPGRARYGGELSSLVPRLPPEIQAVLAAKPPADSGAAMSGAGRVEDQPAPPATSPPPAAPAVEQEQQAPAPKPESAAPAFTKVPKRRVQAVQEAERED